MVKLKNHPIILSLLLLTFFSILAYLPLIPFLGFYSEDFFFSYVGHFFGSSGLINSLAIDRPLNGYLLVFTYSILGDNIFFWHLYTFFLKISGGYLLFFLLKKIWPNKLPVITSITLLFLLYPGFLRQTLPLGYQIYPICLILWIGSLTCSIFAIKSKHKFKLFLFTLIAFFLQIFSFLNLEFFIGMETLRILIIAFITTNEKINFKNIKQSFVYWSPYIISMVIFILWRIFLFKSTRETTDIGWVTQTYYSNPTWILKIPIEIFLSFLHTLVFSYFVPIIINFIRIPLQNSLFALSLGIISSILSLLYFKVLSNDKSNLKNFGRQLLIIGLISVLGALIPIILSGRFVRLFNAFDRYTITSIVGVEFIIIGFLSFKILRKVRKWIIILLVGLSITSHLMNGFWHKIIWDQQKDLWWQLYWRAPNIEKDSMLILYFPPISGKGIFNEIINKVQWYRFYWVEEQIWTAGNLFFNYNNLAIDHFRGDFLENRGTIDKIKNKAIENFQNRNIYYTRNFDNSVIISTPSDSSCLWVLDKERGELPNHANELLKSSIAYSDTSKLVKTEIPIIPPKEIFGNEPSHTWCYYFQKVSLARQLKDWDKLSQLKEEVIAKNLKPKDPNEWLPFEKDLR